MNTIMQKILLAGNLLKFRHMENYTFVGIDEEGIKSLLECVGEVNVITDGDKLEKLSKDFYWYSPVLREMLEDKKAAVAVKICSLDELKSVVALAYQREWPLTVRGGGTGNYGQCIPLSGGLILDMSGFDQILSIEDGVVRAQPGARLGVIEPAAREKGYEMRCLPSTWVKSSLAGFLCGGSGGIGSITWGGLANADNVKSVTLLSAEAEPRLIKFEERDVIDALHTYGTTGIMVEVEMRLAPKRLYQQLIFCHPDWDTLVDWTDTIARRTDIPKRLVTQFEFPVTSWFKPLKKALPEDQHATFLLIDVNHAEEVIALASQAGITCTYNEPLKEPLKPPYITDYTWNHGTLWALKVDPTLTYLQLGFADNFREQIKLLREAFPDEIYQHLEWTAWRVQPKPHGWFPAEPEDVGVGGLPKIRFKNKERLEEMIAFCGSIGVGVANPHTCYLEEGGRHPNLAQKFELKGNLDPKGLLNPGKMRTYPMNPFVLAASA